MKSLDVELFLKDTLQENDRTCAIVSVSFLDTLLTKLLRCAFPPATSQREKIVNELLAALGPLATFAARIKMVFLLNLIDEVDYHNLNVLRKIRNEFAHEFGLVSFDTPPISDLVGNLKPGGTHVEPYEEYLRAWGEASSNSDDKSLDALMEGVDFVSYSVERLKFSASVTRIGMTLGALLYKHQKKKGDLNK
jgi:DNA-binding MltR family transcriptional regulator